ncbi:MAG: ribosome biogenesis factor YjgA [Cellvibrionaceae bacterium]
MNDYHPADGDEEEKSKSQLKREVSALQDLGRKLTELKDEQLARFPLTDDLRLALLEYRRIRKNEAKRRQMQYIGKLMRSADHEGIAATFEQLAAQHRRQIKQEHLAEAWRDKLLEGDAQQVTAFLDEYPATDRQEFRNLVRNAVQERKNNKPPTQARKLFRFVREVIAGK